MPKVLRFSFNDGSAWDVSAHDIAHNRAEYYALADEETTYQAEYDYVMQEDPYELYDWFTNNMNDGDGATAIKVAIGDIVTFTDLLHNSDYEHNVIDV